MESWAEAGIPEEALMRELLIQQPIFIGFKVDNRLREKLQSLSDLDKNYVSVEGSAFLQLCAAGDDLYVGKLVNDGLTSDRVDDICRNVASILRKLGHEGRVPRNLQILACSRVEDRRLVVDRV